MDILDSLGLNDGWLYETVASVRVEESWNPLPLGVWRRGGLLELRVFKVSKTYESFLERKDFVVHFPGHLEDLYYALFEKDALEFASVDNSGFPVLKDSSASLLMKVKDVKDQKEYLTITAEPVDSRICAKSRLINRAECLFLETLIAYSKISHVPDERKEHLLRNIKENHRVIGISAPGSRFQSLSAGLLERIE